MSSSVGIRFSQLLLEKIAEALRSLDPLKIEPQNADFLDQYELIAPLFLAPTYLLAPRPPVEQEELNEDITMKMMLEVERIFIDVQGSPLPESKIAQVAVSLLRAGSRLSEELFEDDVAHRLERQAFNESQYQVEDNVDDVVIPKWSVN